MVARGGIEPPTRGFSVQRSKRAIDENLRHDVQYFCEMRAPKTLIPQIAPLNIGHLTASEAGPGIWLRHVLERIADHPINKIYELLPWNVVEKLPSLRLAV
jgi:IS66 C-terminal element